MAKKRKPSAYDAKAKERTIRYMESRCKRIYVTYTKTEFEQKISPAVAQSNLPMATFFKKAADYYIVHRGWEEKEDGGELPWN